MYIHTYIDLEWYQMLTSISIKADSCVEPLPGLEDIESELYLWAVPARVDFAQGMLQVHPETDLLQSSAAGRIPLQSSHLEWAANRIGGH